MANKEAKSNKNEKKQGKTILEKRKIKEAKRAQKGK